MKKYATTLLLALLIANPATAGPPPVEKLDGPTETWTVALPLKEAFKTYRYELRERIGNGLAVTSIYFGDEAELRVEKHIWGYRDFAMFRLTPIDGSRTSVRAWYRNEQNRKWSLKD